MSSDHPSRGGARRALDVLLALTLADLLATRELTMMGVLRWMLEPLSYMFVYFILVATILQEAPAEYPLFLLCALVPFQFFVATVIGSMGLLQRFSNVLTNMSVPKVVLPLILILIEGANLIVALILFIPMVFVYQVPLWPSLMLLPVVLVPLTLVTIGPAYFGTLFGLYFPDFRGVAGNLVRVSLFASTALVPLEEIPGDQLPRLIQANPLSAVFDSFRAIFIHGRVPQLSDLLYPSIAGVLMLVAVLPFYRASERRFPKEVG